MTLNDYQHALHTYKKGMEACYALGLVGELAEVLSETVAVTIAAGNVADMVKKQTSHGVPLDREKLKKELGDVLWYITAVASDNGLSLEDIARANVEKLKARYPNGFVKGGGVRKEDKEQAVIHNIATERPRRLGAVFFACGCSRSEDEKGVPQVKRCADGQCQRIPR